MSDSPLDPANKIEYKDNEYVNFILPGNEQAGTAGRQVGIILGKVSEHIIDYWIVEPMRRIEPFSAWSIPHTHIRPYDESDFLCFRQPKAENNVVVVVDKPEEETK